MLLYLHGFCSSPASGKARSLQTYMAERGLHDQFWCGPLPVSAHLAMAMVDAIITACPEPPTLVGSSLGGFYATWLAEKHGLKAVVINPVVWSAIDPERFLGEQRNYHTGDFFEFTREHVAELSSLALPQLSQPERFWLLAERGDEVLPCAAAEQYYAASPCTVLDGGDHGFSRFDDYRDEILRFAGLA